MGAVHLCVRGATQASPFLGGTPSPAGIRPVLCDRRERQGCLLRYYFALRAFYATGRHNIPGCYACAAGQPVGRVSPPNMTALVWTGLLAYLRVACAAARLRACRRARASAHRLAGSATWFARRALNQTNWWRRAAGGGCPHCAPLPSCLPGGWLPWMDLRGNLAFQAATPAFWTIPHFPHETMVALKNLLLCRTPNGSGYSCLLSQTPRRYTRGIRRLLCIDACARDATPSHTPRMLARLALLPTIPIPPL